MKRLTIVKVVNGFTITEFDDEGLDRASEYIAQSPHSALKLARVWLAQFKEEKNGKQEAQD